MGRGQSAGVANIGFTEDAFSPRCPLHLHIKTVLSAMAWRDRLKIAFAAEHFEFDKLSSSNMQSRNKNIRAEFFGQDRLRINWGSITNTDRV